MRSWLPFVVAISVGVLLWVSDVVSGQAPPPVYNELPLAPMHEAWVNSETGEPG